MTRTDRLHLQQRGTLTLRYHPAATACGKRCGWLDDDGVRHHRCGLGREHHGKCEFSSECEKWHELNQINITGQLRRIRS
jgi:hypothetical protein